MAKNKKQKKNEKQKKQRPARTPSNRELSKRVDRFVEANDVTYDELAMAGIGYLGTKLPGKKHKNAKKQTKKVRRKFDELVEWGERLAPESVAVTASALAADEALADAPEPVISYQPHGGGWFAIEIDGVLVERVQGEDNAAQTAGALLAAYAALEADEQSDGSTSVTHTGGGWYEVVVRGVPIDRIRGKDAVTERFGHLLEELGESAEGANTVSQAS